MFRVTQLTLIWVLGAVAVFGAAPSLFVSRSGMAGTPRSEVKQLL
jgi:hypothetical protein